MKTQKYWIGLLSAQLRRDAVWLSLRDAAYLFRVTPETMLLWVRDGYVAAECWDGAYYIERTTLEALLRRLPGRPLMERAAMPHARRTFAGGASAMPASTVCARERGERCDR